jgi:hypothetical protein
MPESYRYSQYEHDRGNPDLRAGDRDRAAVADRLRAEHLAGRLETEEFEERLDRCYAAKTYRELDALTADLPSEGRERPRRRAWRWPALVAVVPLLIALAALSHGRLLWLAFPLFFLVGKPFLWRAGCHPFACGSARQDRHADGAV